MNSDLLDFVIIFNDNWFSMMILTGKFHLIVHLIQQVDQKVYAYLTRREAHGLTQELPEKFSILKIEYSKIRSKS